MLSGGNSSVGRAQPCQGWGRGFESRFPLFGGRNGGIGRHEGLKIPWPVMAVRVRVPLAAPFLKNLFNMRKNLILSLSAVSLLALTSCSSKLGALSADNFNVVPNPLESNGGNVTFVVNGNFPEKYMNKKAVVTVTPQLRYNGEALNLNSQTFQG